MIYSLYDVATGAVLGILESPSENDAIASCEVGQAVLAGDWSNHLIVEGVPQAIIPPAADPVAELTGAKEYAVGFVNVAIGSVRARYITDIPGQGMIYQAKEAEAIDYLSRTPEPSDLSEFPFLANEIGTTAPTASELAQVWINLSSQWRGVGSQLENLRLGTLAAVEAATSPAEVDTIISNFTAAVGAF